MGFTTTKPTRPSSWGRHSNVNRQRVNFHDAARTGRDDRLGQVLIPTRKRRQALCEANRRKAGRIRIHTEAAGPAVGNLLEISAAVAAGSRPDGVDYAPLHAR